MKIHLSVAVILLFLWVVMDASAIFILDPEKDLEVTRKTIQNEDGTVTIVEEVNIIKPFEPPVKEVPEGTPVVTHANRWAKTMGLHEPSPARYEVSRQMPDNWPIPAVTKGRDVPKAPPEKRSDVFYWFMTMVSIGVIAFAFFKLYFYMREGTGPNRI